MIARLHAVAIVLVGVLCSQAESFQNEASFEVSGFIQHRVVDKDSTNLATPFKMLVMGQQWQLRTFGENGAFSETTCDGQTIFHFDSTNTIRFGARLNLPSKGYSTFVEPAPIPSGGPLVAIPWLAYASSSLATNRPSEFPAPWLDARKFSYAHLYESKVFMSTDQPSLAKGITFVLNQKRAEKASYSLWLATEYLTPGELKLQREKFKPFAPYGFEHARYRVFAVTNLNGLTLPVAFYLDIYSPQSSKGIREVFYGANITIKELAPKPLKPTVPDGPFLITDFRFQNPERNISFLRYVSSSWIPSAKADVLQKLFALKLENPKAPPESFIIQEPGRKPIFAFVLLAVSFLAPLGFILHRWRSST